MVELLNAHPLIVLAFGIGVVAGLRSLTPPAAVAWAAHFGWLNLQGTRLAWMSSIAVVALFTLLASTELVVDKLPNTASRIAPWSLAFRACMGGLCGAAIALALHLRAVTGVEPAVIGSFVGSFAGFQVRMRLVKEFHAPAIRCARRRRRRHRRRHLHPHPRRLAIHYWRLAILMRCLL